MMNYQFEVSLGYIVRFLPYKKKEKVCIIVARIMETIGIR